MQGQRGFWDVEDRLKELSEEGYPLERLAKTVDFELFRPALVEAVGRSPADHLKSMDGASLRLNHIVKLRHKPISHSEIDNPPQFAEMEGAVKTPLTLQGIIGADLLPADVGKGIVGERLVERIAKLYAIESSIRGRAAEDRRAVRR